MQNINGEKKGGKNMGKFFKIILAIGFFPVVIFYYLLKWIFLKVKRKVTKKYIANIDIKKIDGLDGEEFEDLLAIYFESLGLKVTKTKRSHDYGADLIVERGDEKVAIQCKLYFNRTVSNSAVQEIASAKDFYGAEKAVVITNSRFTKPAQILAEKIGVKLIDREGLVSMLKSNSVDM